MMEAAKNEAQDLKAMGETAVGNAKDKAAAMKEAGEEMVKDASKDQ